MELSKDGTSLPNISNNSSWKLLTLSYTAFNIKKDQTFWVRGTTSHAKILRMLHNEISMIQKNQRSKKQNLGKKGQITKKTYFPIIFIFKFTTYLIIYQCHYTLQGTLKNVQATIQPCFKKYIYICFYMYTFSLKF